jgi:RimJ/RimL family protein N-acetyltransferase
VSSQRDTRRRCWSTSHNRRDEPAPAELDVTRISLNVFGDNTIAYRLYQHVGYATVATWMQKDI